MKILQEKDISLILEKFKLGKPITRSEKIWFQNIEGVRKAGIKYFMSQVELDEYVKCKNSIIYFAENYYRIRKENGDIGLVKLYDHQKEAIRHFEENRFSIFLSSRQMGISAVLSICLLHDVLFSLNKSSFIFPYKLDSGIELMRKIKDAYKTLPFFIKIGVHKWTEKTIVFENGSSVSVPIKHLQFHMPIDNIVFVDFAFNPISEELYKNFAPLLNKGSKLIIQSSPNDNNFFYKLIEDSERKEGDPMKNNFKTLRTYYWQIDSRDKEWVKNEINKIGEELFYREYGLSFYKRT